MSIENLLCSENLKNILKNELKNIRKSGAYILHGNDKKLLFEIALAFGKSLNCERLKEDFCGQCETCKRMDSGTHGDLEILQDDNGIKIERIREMIYTSSTSSYEGKNKIFILKDINKIKSVSGNALLKTIEEPLEGNYYFLLSTSLNILPTIKSRCTIIRVPQLNYNELGVTREIFEFFNGSAEDISRYKESGLKLDVKTDIREIESYLKEYWENEANISYKIRLYSCIREFVEKIRWYSDLEKLQFIEGICRGAKEREKIYEVLSYIGSIKDIELDLEKIIEAKNRIRVPTIAKGILFQIFF